MNSEMSKNECIIKFKSCYYSFNNPNKFLLSYAQIFALLGGNHPGDCDVKIVYDLEANHFIPTGLCRCPARRTVPPCKQCQHGRSFRSKSEAENIIREIRRINEANLPSMLVNINNLFLAFGSFANFLSSSFFAIRLQSRCCEGQRKSLTLCFDFKSIFRRIMRDCERNSLSLAWKRCDLGSDISEIFRYVRMPISSGSIFPDFADISIRNQLLTLSLSMSMFFRMLPLVHLNHSVRNQMCYMQCFAKYICCAFIRKQQMQKCK